MFEFVATAAVVVATPFYARFLWRRFRSTQMGWRKRSLAHLLALAMAVVWALAFSQVNIALGLAVGVIAGAEIWELFAYHSDGGPENLLRVGYRNLRRVWKRARA